MEGNARFEGYSLDLIDAVAQLLGASYKFVLTPDGKYGAYNKVTKQWDGLIRQLLDGVSVFVIGPDIVLCHLPNVISYINFRKLTWLFAI